ncbi:UNVERIFIED_CONTAM: hypothetical protein Scaly_0083400 [Sesamum calycinum]|uniref:Uncharacterized protein n=1 Tax=Sesamum calycinum TaxID=2727403 RepID=A0AAW2SUT0_9LAMI
MAGYNLQPFDGKSDFSIWQQKMKGILIQQKVFIAIDRKYADNVSGDKKLENDEYAYLSIILNLSDSVIQKVGKQISAKMLWDKLEELYTETSLPSKLFLLEKFFRYKLDMSKTIDENIPYSNAIGSVMYLMVFPIGKLLNGYLEAFKEAIWLKGLLTEIGAIFWAPVIDDDESHLYPTPWIWSKRPLRQGVPLARRWEHPLPQEGALKDWMTHIEKFEQEILNLQRDDSRDFFKSLTKKPPTNFYNVLALAKSYINLEEAREYKNAIFGEKCKEQEDEDGFS